MFLQEKLSNGLTFIKAPLRQTKTVTVLVMFRVGSRYEEEDTNGVAHFLEHMFFKGTSGRPAAIDISKELDSVGAEYNAFTSKDHTGYHIKVSEDKLELALDVLSDMLFASKFDAEEIAKERHVIVEELKMYKENPLMYLDDLFETMMYDGTKLGWDIGGTAKTVMNMTRESIVSFMEKYYEPDNTVLSISGSLSEDVDALVQKYFVDKFPNKEPGSFDYDTFEKAWPEKPQVKVDHRETEQVQLGLGFPAYTYTDKKLAALRLLSVILGGNMSSRLFISVRERNGLAYSVSCSASPYTDTGSIVIQAGLDFGRLEKALEVIVHELKSVKDDGVTDIELSRAKDFLRGKLVLSMEDSENVARWYGKQFLYAERPKTLEEKFAEFDRVSAEDIVNVAREVFVGSRSHLALIGPIKDTERLLKILNF